MQTLAGRSLHHAVQKSLSEIRQGHRLRDIQDAQPRLVSNELFDRLVLLTGFSAVVEANHRDICATRAERLYLRSPTVDFTHRGVYPPFDISSAAIAPLPRLAPTPNIRQQQLQLLAHDIRAVARGINSLLVGVAPDAAAGPVGGAEEDVGVGHHDVEQVAQFPQ